MSDSKNRECGACKHWDSGSCYRFPPQMVPYPVDNQAPALYFPTSFRPYVGAAERACGEWSDT